MADLGDVYVEAHVDNKHVAPELEKGVKEAAEKVEKEDDFGGFVKSAEKAGSRAGKEFGSNFFRDADGRLRSLDGRFVAEGKKIGDNIEKGIGEEVESKLGKRIRGFGHALAPQWIKTIAAWTAVLTPVVSQLLAVLLPAVGVLGLLVPAAIGAAAAVVGLKLALNGVGQAIKDIGTKKFADDLKKLAPAAQAFVKQIAKFKPAFHDFQQEVQQGFFSGLGIKVVGQLNRLLRGVHNNFQAIAFTLGDIGKGFGDFISKSSTIKKLNTIFGDFDDTLFVGRDVLNKIVDILLTIGSVAGQFLPGLTKSLDGILGRFDAFLSRAANDGSLGKFFDTALTAFGQLWTIVTDVYRVFSDLIQAGAQAGGGGGIIDLLGIIADTFDQLKDSGALASLFQTFNQLFSTAGTLLAILLPPLGDLIVALSGPLKEGLKNLTPGLSALATAVAQLVVQVTPAIVTLLTGFLNLFLVPFFNLLADNPTMAQILIDVAAAIGLVVAATKLWAAAQALLDVALDANPIGVFILVVAALGVALYSIYVNTKKIIDAFLHPSERTPFFQGVLDILGKIGGAISDFITKTIPNFFSKISNFFTNTLPNTISTGLNAILTFFTNLPGQIWNFISSIPNLLFTLFTNAFNLALQAVGIGIGLIFKAFTGIPPLLLHAVENFGVLLVNWMTTAWAFAKQAAVTGTEALINFVKGLPQRIINTLVSLAAFLGQTFHRAWDAALAAVKVGVGNVVSFIAGLPGKVVALGTKLYNAGVSIIKALLNGLAHPGGVINSIGDKVIGIVKGALNGLIKQINKGIDKVNSAIPFGSPVPHIPLLAKGALITKPTLAILGESGPEVVAPVNDPRRSAELLNDSGLGAHLAAPGGDTYVLVQIGDETIQAKVDKSVNSNNARTAFALTAGTRAA